MKADNNDASIFFPANETQHLDDAKKMEPSEVEKERRKQGRSL